MFNFIKNLFKEEKVENSTTASVETIKQSNLYEKKQEEQHAIALNQEAGVFAEKGCERLLSSIIAPVNVDSTNSKRFVENVKECYGDFFYDMLIPIGIVKNEIERVFKDKTVPYSVRLYEKEITKEQYNNIEYGFMKARDLVEKFLVVQKELEEDESKFIQEEMKKKQEEFIKEIMS